MPENAQAKYILVTRNGWLWAGTKEKPHPAGVSIQLEGTRQTPDFAIREDLNLGSKVGWHLGFFGCCWTLPLLCRCSFDICQLTTSFSAGTRCIQWWAHVHVWQACGQEVDQTG